MSDLYRHKLVTNGAKITGIRQEPHNALDLVGHKFGMVLVQSLAGKDKNQNKLWNCLCDCGNKSIATSANLRSGNSASCGCKKIEANLYATQRQRNKSINQLSERIALLSNPFTLDDAAVIFDGDRIRASKWIHENMQTGHFKKIKKGIYEKNSA